MSTFLFSDIVFGPIHSRRLGISLGVNLLPTDGKTCSFDCIYCECGLNAQRRGKNKLPLRYEVYTALEEQLKKMQSSGQKPDVITFAGNGEPTLHPDFEAIIDDTLALRDAYFPTTKVSVLSNATRINKPDIFRALNRIDNNILKLDSAFTATIRQIDSPVSSAFTAAELIEGLKQFKGNLIIQTLFLRGTQNGEAIDNTTPAEVEAWLKAIKEIAPRQVMIYTIDRETPVKNLEKIPVAELNVIADKVRAIGIDVSVSG